MSATVLVFPAPAPIADRMAHTYRALPASVRQLLTTLAEQLEPGSDEIARAMLASYEAEIPEYAAIADEALLEDVHSVSAVLVRCWLRMLSSGDPADDYLLTLFREGARRRVAQGVELSSLLRAYRIGVRVMWSEITESPSWRASRSIRAASARITSWMLDYVDLLCTQVEVAYLQEAAQVARQREHRRSALLNVILANSTAESVERPVELDRPHLIAVVEAGGDRSLTELESTALVLEQASGALMWTVRHRSVVAAVPAATQLQRAAVVAHLRALVGDGSVLRAAVGGSAESARDSRSSYAEAIDALRVGPTVHPEQPPVYDYLALAPLIAALQRPEQARRYVAMTLEPFACLAGRLWALPTLEAYLIHQGRQREVAGALNIHVNTVKYRLNELRVCGGVDLTDGGVAASLLLALQLRRALEDNGP